MAASMQAAQAHGKKPGHTWKLCRDAKKKLCRDAKNFVESQEVPTNTYGAWLKL